MDADIGIDPSWEAAVALARIHHLAWGPDVAFTYGPLAFLQNTGYYSREQALLATVYQVSTLVALFLAVAAALRRRHTPASSLAGAAVTTVITGILLGPMYPEVVILAAFAWAGSLLLPDDHEPATAFVTCVLLGAVGGFELLVKFNTGPVVAGVALAASVLLDWRAVGRHLAAVTAFIASVPLWWLLAGQRLGNLTTWLKYSSEIVSGYIEGQAVPIPWDAVGAVALTLAWIAAVCAMFVRGRSEIPRRFVVLVAIVTVVVTKTAFGRYDSNHFSVLLGLIVVTVAITPLLGILRRGIEIALAVLFVVYLAGILVVEQRPVAVLQAPVRAVDRVLTLGWPDLATRHIEQSKARQRAHYGVPDRFIKAIGSGTVHVDPDETSVVWAYGLAWRPAPVFQTYSVYTPTLDKLNGDTLASGPQFVLSRRSPTSPATGINDRLGVQENPLYSLALLCNYTRTDAENGWILFSRNGSHCGPLAPLAEVTVHDGDVVNVPAPSAPGMAVLVGIGLKPTVLDRAFMGAVVPLTAFTVVLDGMSYRLISGNAAEPFLVASPASADGTNLEINARTIGIGRTRSLGQGGVAARLRFYEMRVQS